ncbi:hypothetical protein AB0H76_01215 [Nocardia sp. NPDC050712]|uniref:hypothetical protein n=1 Tax=Nocardia sp. NPDC050712 TaxID=3155518 RepID=UPI0033D0DCF4
MLELSWILLPVGIVVALRTAATLGGGTDLDYRRQEERAAYLHRDRSPAQLSRR